MKRSLPPVLQAALWPLATALGYFLLAALSLHATKGADNIAALWPPSGYFLALLLLMPVAARRASFAAAALASVAANMQMGATPAMAAAFTVANLCEAALALWLIRRREPGELSFMVPRAVGSFCIAALIAGVASAAIATLSTGGHIDFFLSWLTTVSLGMLIVAPPIVMLARLIGSHALDNASGAMKAEAVVILFAAGALTAAVFSQSQFPLTFVPCIAVVAAAYRLGPFGAASSVLIVAIIAAPMTGQGVGPIAWIDTSAKGQVFFLQFYLLSLLFASLPLAALLVVQRRLARRLEQSNRWLLQAEAAALVGHWRVDLNHWTIHWSDQAYRIHGLEPGAPMSIRASLDLYMPGDGARLRATLEDAVQRGAPFEYQGQVIRPDDDQVRDIASHGSIEFNRAGRPIGIFGTIQDVTDTVENARALEAARNSAEEAANTDLLTGLPNRRRTLLFLDRAFALARDGGAPLAVAIFDIDYFKRINDDHGHAAGDAVIRRVGQRAKSSLREEDMVGRFGGEEFVCVFQGQSAIAAEMVAERVRKAVETEEIEDSAPKVTISIGLAIFDGEATTDDLLQRADQALYAAKRDGRNRLRLAA